MPSEPVVLSIAQIEELNQNLANMRHDINNSLSLVMAVAELMRHKPNNPQSMERWLNTLTEHPKKIATALGKFTSDFEQTFGIKRD